MPLLRTLLVTFGLAATLLPAAHAAVVWDESVSGDFSNTGSSPDFVAVAGGSNQILGTTGASAAGVDLDYFTITVPAGWQLTGLTFLPSTATADGGLGFLGIQAGTQVTTFGAAALLGWTHYSPADIGINMLPFIGAAAGSIGFSGALGAGSYAFWIQDFDFGTSVYAIDLTLAPVPEPAPAAGLLAGLLALGLVRTAGRIRFRR